MSKFLPTQPIDPLPGRPLMMNDIFMECVQHEDRLMHIEVDKASVIPPSARKELPKQNWSPAATHAFHRGIFRRTLSILTP